MTGVQTFALPIFNSWLNTSFALQVVSLAMPITIVFCGEAFLGLWLGSEYAAQGRIVLYVLAVGLTADCLANNALRMLTAQGKHGRIAMIWLVLSITSIPLAVVGAYMWGIAGIAIGLTAITVIGNLISLFMGCSVMLISVMEFSQKTLFRLFSPLTCLALSYLVLNLFVKIQNYLILVIHLVVAGSIYLCALWLFSFDSDVRKRFKHKIRTLLVNCVSSTWKM